MHSESSSSIPIDLVKQLLAGPAYTTVTARQSLRAGPATVNHHPPSHSNEPAQAQKSARDWPQPVRQYVQRSFAEHNSIPGIDRVDMEAKLKKIISDAAESNTLLTLDWEHMLLPQQILQNERIHYIPLPVAATSSQLSNLYVDDTNHSSHPIVTKKRKSSDLAQEPMTVTAPPPWRVTNQRSAFEDRLSYPDKRQRTEKSTFSSSKAQIDLESRKRRFQGDTNGLTPTTPYFSPKEISPPKEVQGPIVGRCQNLEKRYFRLTAPPNPDAVRPLPVLEKALEFLKQKWRMDNNYAYICDQFKSLRQDLTVQHIKTDFTVNVYEIHARIALEKGDLGEYNQCQTQLRALYAQKLGGHPTEFKAYRILYFIHTCNRTDMNDVLADLTPAEKNAPAIKHALEARSSLALGNFHRFFKLYLETPNMGAYLMDMFVARERLAALAFMCKA